MNKEEKDQERYRIIAILISSILLVTTVCLSLSSFEENQAGGGRASVQNEKEYTETFKEAAEKAALLEAAQITDTQASETVLEVNQGASVVAVKLENENEVAVYEIIIKTQDGNLIEVLVDAVKNVIVPEDIEEDDESQTLESL